MSDIIKVTRRDFTRDFKKYLKPGKVILTNQGKDEYCLTIECLTDKPKTLSDKPEVKERIEKVLTTVPGMATVEKKPFIPNWQKDNSTYGCGCKKVEGKSMCPKHDRR